MTPKKTKQEMQKVVLYSFLYLETLDKLKPINPKVIKFKEDIIGFLEAIGRTGKAKGGRQYDDEFQMPIFLTANNLKPLIDDSLIENSKSILFTDFIVMDQFLLTVKMNLENLL